MTGHATAMIGTEQHWRRSARAMALALVCASAAIGIGASSGVHAGARGNAKLPTGFVHLRDSDPTIRQDIRYATPGNFTGKVVPGYEASECILLEAAATALARVQKNLHKQGLSLLVLDCYRPERAVRAFVEWTRLAKSPQLAFFNPRVRRGALIAEGYIASTSGHSRGDCVDLTIIHAEPADPSVLTPVPSRENGAGSCITSGEPPPALDMGTSYDCFDKRSHTRDREVSVEQLRNRLRLTSEMTKAGWRPYPREWWHFCFASKQGRTYDFPIVH